MELVTQIIQELDQSAAGTAVASIRQYPALQNADVLTVVSAVQQIFGPGSPGPARPRGGVREAPCRDRR